jgi:hypothetical protein
LWWQLGQDAGGEEEKTKVTVGAFPRKCFYDRAPGWCTKFASQKAHFFGNDVKLEQFLDILHLLEQLFFSLCDSLRFYLKSEQG